MVTSVNLLSITTWPGPGSFTVITDINNPTWIALCFPAEEIKNQRITA